MSPGWKAGALYRTMRSSVLALETIYDTATKPPHNQHKRQVSSLDTREFAHWITYRQVWRP